MPQFQSDAANRAGINLDPFVSAYILAAYWTSTGDSDQPDSEAEMSLDAINQAIAECNSFRVAAAAELAIACDRNGYSEERAGHDFWLTRNGHGCGYWDRDELEAGNRDRLSDLAREAGHADLYDGDNGLLYFG